MGLMMSDEVVKTTNISYCAECYKDFADNETCNYTWYENNVFCHDCKEVMRSLDDDNTKVIKQAIDIRY